MSLDTVKARVDAPPEAVIEAADDPRVLLESIPSRYVEYVDEAGARVTLRVGRSIFSRVRLTFTATASRGKGEVVLSLISGSATIEFHVKVEGGRDQSLVAVEPRIIGLETGALRRISMETASNLVKLIADRASTIKPLRAEEKAGVGGVRAESEARPAVEPEGLFVMTGKLEDPIFEAEVAIHGKALYADITGYTTLAEVLEQFMNESVEGSVYIKISFNDGYTLKVLMEKGKIEGVLGEFRGQKFKGYDAVREAERRAPSGVLVIAYAL